MDLLRRILFPLFTVLCFELRNIYGQRVNTSLDCSKGKDCQTCVQDSSCFWCEKQRTCKVYGVKNKDEETKNCGELSWKSCQKPDAPLVAIISGCASAVLICVLFVLVCIKRDLWNRVIASRFCRKRYREGLFETEERFIRKRKHKKKLGVRAKKFTEKYQLNDSTTFLYSP